MCAIKPVTATGNWNSTPQRNLGNSVEPRPHPRGEAAGCLPSGSRVSLFEAAPGSRVVS